MQTTDGALGVVNNWLAAFNLSDWQQFSSYLAADATFTFSHALPAGSATLRGRDAVLDSYQGWRTVFSELQAEITDGFACDNRVAVQLHWSGRSADGDKPISFPACFLMTVENGQITAIADFFDQLTYDAQF